MIFETRAKKKFKKKTDNQGNIYLDALWENVDMDELILPHSDHLNLTLHAFKKQANIFVRRLFWAGAFENFSLAEQKEASYGWMPKGYEIALKIPLQCGGNYHLSNFALMPKGYSDILYSLYFGQLAEEVVKQAPLGKKIHVSFPHIPDFVLPENFSNILFPEDRQQVFDFLQKQKSIHKTIAQKVEKTVRGKKVFFKLRKAPSLPFACTWRETQIHFPNLLDRRKITQKYAHAKETLLSQALQRGDFDFLPPKQKAYLVQKHKFPAGIKLTCHHILPRRLGGENTLENVVWMNEEDHKKLHTQALNLLTEAALNEADKDEKKAHFIVLPVPQSSLPEVNLKKEAVPIKRRMKIFKRCR